MAQLPSTWRIMMLHVAPSAPNCFQLLQVLHCAPSYSKLVLENGTSLFFIVEHGWANSDPNKWYQSYGHSLNDVVGADGAILGNSRSNKVDPEALYRKSS